MSKTMKGKKYIYSDVDKGKKEGEEVIEEGYNFNKFHRETLSSLRNISTKTDGVSHLSVNSRNLGLSRNVSLPKMRSVI